MQVPTRIREESGMSSLSTINVGNLMNMAPTEHQELAVRQLQYQIGKSAVSTLNALHNKTNQNSPNININDNNNRNRNSNNSNTNNNTSQNNT